MSHTVTSKLNKAARQHTNEKGVTFFVSLGEKNYNFQTKENEWTNYDATLFAKDAQIQFYNDNLVEGAIVTVSGSGLIMEAQTDPQYKPKLMIQDAKLTFISNGQSKAPAPQQQGGFAQQAPQQSAPKEVPTENDLAWVDLIHSKQKTLNDIKDEGYRAKIQSLL